MLFLVPRKFRNLRFRKFDSGPVEQNAVSRPPLS
jgi:hypothetical protein